MKRLMIALLAVAAIFSGVSAAEAQRWHGRPGYNHRYYGHRYYGPRRGYYRPHYGRRAYYRHGRRYWR